MPIYQLQLPDGKMVGVQQDSPPTEQDYKRIVGHILVAQHQERADYDIPSSGESFKQGFFSDKPLVGLAGDSEGSLVTIPSNRNKTGYFTGAFGGALDEINSLISGFTKPTSLATLVPIEAGPSIANKLGQMGMTKLASAADLVRPVALAKFGADAAAGSATGLGELAANVTDPNASGYDIGRSSTQALVSGLMAKGMVKGGAETPISSLLNSSTKEPLAASNAQANDVALHPDLSVLEPKPNITSDLGDLFDGGRPRSSNTPGATDAQAKIEAELGIGGQAKSERQIAAEKLLGIEPTGSVEDFPNLAAKADPEIAREAALRQAADAALGVKSEPAIPADQTILADRISGRNPISEDSKLGDLVGTDVAYGDYYGKLVRDADGNFVIVREPRSDGLPNTVEVEGSGKNPDLMAYEVGLIPTPRVQGVIGADVANGFTIDPLTPRSSLPEPVSDKYLVPDPPVLQNPVKASETPSTGLPEVNPQSSNAVPIQSPAEVPVDSQSGGGSQVRQDNPEGRLQKPARSRSYASQGAKESEVDYRARLQAGIKKTVDRVKASPTVDLDSKAEIGKLAKQASDSNLPTVALQGIHNDMLDLEQSGRETTKARDAEVAKQDSEASQELKDSKSKKLEDREKSNQIGQRLGLGSRIGTAIKDSLISVRNGYKAIDQHTSNRDTVFNYMDGFQKFRGAMNRVFGGRLDLAYVEEQNLKSDWKEGLKELADGLDPKSMERINIYAHARMDAANPDLPNSHLSDSGITPELASSIKLTAKEQAFYNAARKVLDEQSGPTVRQTMHHDFNVDVGQVKDYWPTQVIGRRSLKTAALGEAIPGEAGHEAALNDLVKALREDFSGRDTTKTNEGQTKEKIAEAGGEINLSDNLIDRHLNQTAHLVSHAKELQSLGRIARQDWFREKYGDKGQKYVLDLLDSVARDSDPAGSKRIPIVDAISKNYAVSVLALRIFSQLKHVSNVALAVNEVGPGNLARGFIDTNSSNGKAWLKKNAPEAFQRSGGETSIQELLEGNRFQKLQGSMFAIERVADRQIAAASTLGAYKAELQAMGKSTENYLTDPVNKEALQHALITARKVVTSSLRKDSPQAISRGALTGGGMTLSRVIFQFGQTALRQIHYAKTELGNEGLRKGDVGNAAKASAALLAGLAIETAMVEASKSLTGAKTNQKDEAPFIQEMAIEAARKVPGLGNIRAAAGHGDTGIPTVDITTHGIQSIGQILSGKNEYNAPLKGKGLEGKKADAATFAASVFGIPGASTLGQLYKNRVIKK